MEKVALNAHLWARDPDDWYIEREWCSAGLFSHATFEGPIIDPFAGSGRILDAAADAGYGCAGFDVRDRGLIRRHEFRVADFFDCPPRQRFRSIVTNPPYAGASEIVPRLVAMAEFKAAILLPSRWANGKKAAALLESLPLRRVLALSPRPSMPPGRAIQAGIKPGGGTIDFSWFIFEHGYRGEPGFGWVRRPPLPPRGKGR